MVKIKVREATSAARSKPSDAALVKDALASGKVPSEDIAVLGPDADGQFIVAVRGTKYTHGVDWVRFRLHLKDKLGREVSSQFANSEKVAATAAQIDPKFVEAHPEGYDNIYDFVTLGEATPTKAQRKLPAGKPSTYHAAICKKNDAGAFNKRTSRAFEVEASSPEELLRTCLSKAGYDAGVELEGMSIDTMDDVTDYLLGLEEVGGYMVTSLEGPGISYESPNYEG